MFKSQTFGPIKSRFISAFQLRNVTAMLLVHSGGRFNAGLVVSWAFWFLKVLDHHRLQELSSGNKAGAALLRV